MYCPHCGRPMQVVAGELTCVAGGMSLSQELLETLTARFPVQRPRPASVEVGRRLTRWFCPGCGVPLDPEMTCRACGQSLHDQLFTLVDIHPHALR